MRVYSNPSRASLPHSEPDVEVWEVKDGFKITDTEPMESQPDVADGFYYYFKLPGGLPQCDPVGPFKTLGLAIMDAQGVTA